MAGSPSSLADIDSTNVRSLAGDFDVVLINQVGGWSPAATVLRLSLQRTDSTPTYRFGMMPGPRPLQGTAIYQSDSAKSPVPTVMIRLTLYIGGGIDGADWSGRELTATAMTMDGFRGTWGYDGGISIVIDRKTGQRLADPKGFFCARRRTPGGA